MPFRILSISYDPVLLHTRQQILEQHGYSVFSAEGFSAALETCRDKDFDVVVMGHSIPHDDKQMLLEEVHKKCNAPVVALLRNSEPPLDGAAESIDPLSPANLLNAVGRVLNRKPNQ
jgi:DNA-binding response OmpR family regulator